MERQAEMKRPYLQVVLYRMYSRFAEVQGWKTEVIEASPTGLGGYKEIIFMINGNGAYSKVEIRKWSPSCSTCS